MHCDWLGQEKRYRLYVFNDTNYKIDRSSASLLTGLIYTASEYEPAVNEVQVPVLNREICKLWLAHEVSNFTDGMICAGYPDGGKDACQVN